MNTGTLDILLVCFSIVLLLAIYWVLFKIRNDMNESQGKILSELSEIRKSLEKKTGTS